MEGFSISIKNISTNALIVTVYTNIKLINKEISRMKKATEYTLKEAARIVGVSTQTIKRRIEKGEITARKELTEIGIERWLIPSEEIAPAQETEALNKSIAPIVTESKMIPTPKKQIGIYEIQNVVQNVLKAQTKEIETHIKGLERKIDSQTKLLDEHYRLVDERLRLSIKEKKERLDKKPLWKKILSFN